MYHLYHYILFGEKEYEYLSSAGKSTSRHSAHSVVSSGFSEDKLLDGVGTSLPEEA